MNKKVFKKAFTTFKGSFISYWLLLIFCTTHLCFTTSFIDDEPFIEMFLTFSVSIFLPALLGQFLFLFRFRDIFGCCLSYVICFLVAITLSEISHLEMMIGMLFLMGPFATLSGLWSLRAGRDVLALFMPTVCIIGSIVYTVNNSSEEFEVWKVGDKWAIWDISSLSGFIIGIILIVFYLFARERHRVLEWSQEINHKEMTYEASRVQLGQSSLSKILVVLFGIFLAFCVALTAPFLWQTATSDNTGSQENIMNCSEYENPPPHCQPREQENSPPESGCKRKNKEKPESTEPSETPEKSPPKELPQNLIPTLFMLFVSFVLLLILFLVSYRPVRRYIKIRHYKKPLYKISSTEAVENYWELIEISLRDMGIDDISAPSAEQVISRHEEEIQVFLQTSRFQPRLKRIAFIHDKVRYGLQITHSDIEEMKNLSSDFYDATWRRLRDIERIESFYSQ